MQVDFFYYEINLFAATQQKALFSSRAQIVGDIKKVGNI
jgi:hypothetical protein